MGEISFSFYKYECRISTLSSFQYFVKSYFSARFECSFRFGNNNYRIIDSRGSKRRGNGETMPAYDRFASVYSVYAAYMQASRERKWGFAAAWSRLATIERKGKQDEERRFGLLFFLFLRCNEGHGAWLPRLLTLNSTAMLPLLRCRWLNFPETSLCFSSRRKRGKLA